MHDVERQGGSVRRVDFTYLRAWLIAQNVPLPDAYPDKYRKRTVGTVPVYEAAAFGRKASVVR